LSSHSIVVTQKRQATQRLMPDGLDSEGQHGQRSVLLRHKSQAAEGAIIHLCRQDRKRPRRMWRRSSRNRAVLSRAILRGRVPMSRCRQYVSVEILSFLQNIAKQIRDMQKRRSEDRFGHFGQFVMFELRAKLQALHDTFTYMTKRSV